MDRHSREHYLERVREECENADKEGKGRLLDEAAKRTVLNRKVLIRKLARWRPAVVWKKKRRRKRKAIYGATVVSALAVVREIFDYPCGQRLAPALKGELGRPRESGKVRCSPGVAEKLEQISAKTIDQLLGREKQVRHLQRATRAGLDRIRGRPPSAIKELHPDNDSGVINDLLRGYC